MTRWLAIPTAVVGTCLCFLGVLALGFTRATPPSAASAELGDIPPHLLGVYRDAAATCPGLPWQVLAAIGFLESRHGQGHVDPATGDVRPPIMGPPLDGRQGRALIRDPSQPDGFAHALGPMQFLSTTWAAWGRVAPGRTGPPDVQNAWDAIYSAAAYLCGTEGRVTDVRAAVLRYNHSERYVDDVLAKARAYGYGTTTGLAGDGSLAWPVAGPVVSGFGPRIDPILGVERFHAGIDISASEGTPIHAAAAGTVTRAGGEGDCGYAVTLEHASGLRTHYCHMSQVLVEVGQLVAGGEVVGLVGSTGRSTGPHLHFEVYVNGTLVDPLTRLPASP